MSAEYHGGVQDCGRYLEYCTVGGYLEYCGKYLQYRVGYFEYHGGGSVEWADIIINMRALDIPPHLYRHRSH